MKIRILTVGVLSLTLTLAAHAQVPGVINYQGRVSVNGTNFNGTGQFEFALVSGGSNASVQATASVGSFDGLQGIAAVTVTAGGSGYTSVPNVTITDSTGTGAVAVAYIGGGMVTNITVTADGANYTSPTIVIDPPPSNIVYTTYWSNDGSSVAGGQTVSAVSLTVTKGLYSVLLGDTTVSNMTVAVPASTFANSTVNLRVWFNDGVSGFQQLTPDQRLAAAGYALEAASLASPAGGDLRGPVTNATVAKLQGVPITTGSPSPGQYLRYNGSAWTNSVIQSGDLSGASVSNFTGSLAGDVTGTQGATVVGTVGGVSAANLASGANAANSATSTNTAGTIVKRDGSGNITVGTVTGTLNGNASTATSANSATTATTANNFSGSLSGDVTGTQGATVIANGAVTAAKISSGQVVLSLDGLTDAVQLSAGANVTIGTNGNSLTIAATGAGSSTGDVLGARLNIGVGNTLSGVQATIAGGSNNTASATGAFVGGGGNNAIQVGADFSSIGGGFGNVVPSGLLGATIGGGYQNTNSGNYATVAGGDQNTIQSNADRSAIGGGINNTIQASSGYSVIAGGDQNTIQANAGDSFVGGGYNNTVQTNSGFSAIVGGVSNAILYNAYLSAMGGGVLNIIQTNAYESAIGGGGLNTIQVNAPFSTIGGGGSNIIQTNADHATIGGGANNLAGGTGSVVGGGSHNTASGPYAMVGGGVSNTASGFSSTVPGGEFNSASGTNSFAAGTAAIASNTGAFVWADDSSASPFASTSNNQFSVRAAGGVQFFSNAGATTGVALAPGAGSWSSASDRNLKAHFAAVDAEAILDALVAIPVDSWNYKAQDEHIRHIGPMAQDFKAAFGVGEDDRHISEVDAQGIAFAAIQGLNQKLEEQVKGKDTEIQELRRQNDALASRLAALEAKMEKVSEQIGQSKSTAAPAASVRGQGGM